MYIKKHRYFYSNIYDFITYLYYHFRLILLDRSVLRHGMTNITSQAIYSHASYPSETLLVLVPDVDWDYRGKLRYKLSYMYPHIGY